MRHCDTKCQKVALLISSFLSRDSTTHTRHRVAMSALFRASEIARYCSQFAIRCWFLHSADVICGASLPPEDSSREGFAFTLTRGESFALTLAAKLTLALCRGSAKMAKLRRILRHSSQKCLPSIKCLLYKVSTRCFAIS